MCPNQHTMANPNSFGRSNSTKETASGLWSPEGTACPEAAGSRAAPEPCNQPARLAKQQAPTPRTARGTLRSRGPMDSLHIDGVTVRAGEHTLLDDLRLVVHPGELCALLGPSGAGKSTLMKAVLGVRKPASGRVRLGERPMTEAGPIGYVPQDDALHRVLTVEKALDYSAQLRLPSLSAEARHARITDVLTRVDLVQRRSVRVGRLSGGQRKRVSVAMELLTAPPVLVLDEPTSGLDPGMERRTMALFADLASEGRIVIVSTHAMASIQRCQVVVVLVAGKLAYAGPPAGCPEWFEALDMNGIFPAIAKHAPIVWAKKWTAAPASRTALTRPAPRLQPSGAASAPPPSTAAPAPSEPAPSEPAPSASPADRRRTAEAELAALKAKMGRPS